mgnify:FL=1
MNTSTTNLSDTKVKLIVSGNANELASAKKLALAKLAPQVKVEGFRPGRAPAQIVEKHLDPTVLAQETIDILLKDLYVKALEKESLRPVSSPEVSVTKFVPYTDIEFKVEIDIVGPIKLADYKKLKATRGTYTVTAKDITEVLERLQTQMAEHKEVKRAAKEGDRVWIEFNGTDDKGVPVKGASGKDYPLALGSNTFIPGFEKNLIGAKPEDKVKFTIPFPKDYGVKALQNKKVTFDVTVQKVEEVIKPKVDEVFVKKVGAFDSVADLKKDIKKQLTLERGQQLDREYEDALVDEIVAHSTVSLPESMLKEQVEAMDSEFQQNLVYRGQTFQEYLEHNGLTEQSYKDTELLPAAKKRLTAGLVLSSISEKENITVSPEELEIRIQVLKGQHQNDNAMLKELEKPDARRSVTARMLTEKTIAKIVEYNKK